MGLSSIQISIIPSSIGREWVFHGGCGKQYWQARFEGDGVHTRSTGNQYRQQRFDPHPPEGLSQLDPVAELEDFPSDVTENSPFFFWFGIQAPHTFS